MREVHQFHQGIRRGDAIGGEMLALRTILREAGYDSEIFVEQEPDDPAIGACAIHGYRGDRESLLLIHHSIGHDSAGLVGDLPDRKALVFHNITPSRFFGEEPSFARFVERGVSQLRFYRGRVEAAFADSQFNAEELLRLGYERVEVLPPVFGLDRLLRFSAAAPEDRLVKPLILFVGRFAPNKRQEDLVLAFERFARVHLGARLVLAGEASKGDAYARRVFDRIAQSPARERIRVLGRISDEELAHLYSAAALYVSMSEHEGFGLPLLEAFAHDVPVLAFDAGAVAETMGGAGVLFSEKKMDEVAAMMAELISDAGLRARIIAGQHARLLRPDIAEAKERFLRAIEQIAEREAPRRAIPSAPTPASIRIEGPFETSYGLAVANRALAEALDAHSPCEISIASMDGPGDTVPRSVDLLDKPRAHRLWERAFLRGRPDVVVRNTYPPRFVRLEGKLNLSYFFWEDSLLPGGWAEGFNLHFDGVLAPSEWVREVLELSGVTIPIDVIGVPVEPPADSAGRPSADKRIRFLSVGSGFPRKGTDLLLRAFARAFRSGDDVALVIKTFPNVHNRTEEAIAKLRREMRDCPEILHINKDISRPELSDLYRSASALVSPSRAEGFGLPAAEAMLHGIPVIATAATGLADFCGPDTALIVPHRFTPSRSHLGIAGARWAEPDEDALVELLRSFADGTLLPEARRRATNARRLISEKFSPRSVARRADEAISRLFREKARKPRVGYLSTWNSRCGIAQYTGNLVRALPEGAVDVTILGSSDSERLAPDSDNVVRVWKQILPDYSRVVNAALERELDAVHVQFHPGLFSDFHAFARLLGDLQTRGISVGVTLHVLESTFFGGRMLGTEILAGAFRRCAALLSHNRAELERLEALGISGRGVLLPHGGMVFPPRDRETAAHALGLEDRRIIASFGFAFPHKGVLETIEAVRILKLRFPDILFLALASARPEEASLEYLAFCRRRIAELNLHDAVFLIHEFLAEAEIALLLAAAEAVILPYRDTKESASGAVRYPLAAGRATITTEARIFTDVRGVTLQIPEGSPESIAQAVTRLLTEEDLRGRLERQARRFAEEHSWDAAARLHLPFYANRPSRVA